MEFRLLGLLETRHAGIPLPLGGQRQRSVLAALLLRANSLASTSYLTQAVWETPPVAPDSNLRTYVAGLRRMFAAIGEDRIRTRPGGYVLTVRSGELDLDSFRELADKGTNACDHRDFATATACFDQALRLWRGRPLSDLSPGPVLEAEITRLADLRVSIAERRGQAQLEVGQAEEAVGATRALLAEHPLREELWTLLMLALHRAGRRAEALATFARARHMLVTELGIEPGARLRRAHQDILGDDRHPAPTGTTTAAWRQLPMDIAEFTGREAELRALEALADPPSATAVPVAVIHGMAGVGKTRLAVHFAHRLAQGGRYDQVQLWADLRAFDPERAPLQPGAVLENFLGLLGVPGQQIPRELEARAAVYRSRLAGKRVLVLLDNALTAEQVQPLLPGGPGGLVLITSRRSLSGLAGAQGVPLDVLPQSDAVSLLSRVVGDHRVIDDPAAAARVTDFCGRLPIAISLVAQRLRRHPLWTTDDLATRLLRMTSRDQPASGTHDLHAPFTLSYRALALAHQRTFRLLGWHPGDDFTAESAAAIASITPEDAELHLEALLDEHLVLQTTPHRYRLHDLVRSFARGLAHPQEAKEAVDRLLVWYLHAAESARATFDPRRLRVIELHPMPAGLLIPQSATNDDALAWYHAERDTLRQAVRIAAESDTPQIAWQLAWILLSFYYRRSHWDDWIATFQIALTVARSLGDRRAEGIVWRGLGVAHSDMHQFPTSIECHHQAQQALAEVDDRHGQAWNLNNLGVVHVALNELRAALDCFHEALPLFRQTDDPNGEGICLNNLGDTYRRLGQATEAIKHLNDALHLQQQHDDQTGLQFTLCTLGDIHHDAGDHSHARRHYEEALRTSQILSDQRNIARALANLARTLDTQGDHGTARTRWREALTIFDNLGDPQANTIRARLA
ncbi:MAG TPA: BTAD domain-containing putative transcriptional regulator [Actinophytocola sp.]|uniref:AfsR/SARP family transcriptional regulator n=1 Tax=Actinophytocola sp. TaxID=1872138 RepID=UPI002DB7AC61|nr:BTAD domain-containing putative transcriptional regulator [Actinophytocola sp.]HEU5473683.1 BTAD domain-containing putative transcriptional regulator [Actinophytocola sp.]